MAPKEAKEKAPEKKMVTSKELAAKLGTKPASLRRFLRTLPQFQDKNYTRYKWDENDKFLRDIQPAWDKYKASEKEKNKKRLEELKSKKAPSSKKEKVQEIA